MATHNLANWFREAGRSQEALPLDRELFDACRRRFGLDDRRTVISEVVLAATLVEVEKWEDAKALLDHAVDFLSALEGQSSDCRQALDLVAVIDRAAQNG